MALIGMVVVTVLALLFAAKCYYELRRWARRCQHARITVAYKRKVKLDAPLLEWLLWIGQLEKDGRSGGRVVYQMGSTTVALIKGKRPSLQKQAIAAPRQGKWTARDETKQPA